MTQKKILFIVNPTAGQLHAKAGLMGILDTFVKNGLAPTVLVTQARGDARRWAEQAACGEIGPFERMIVCGGDGTLSEAVNGLMEGTPEGTRPIPLGYIPAGSTNDFAYGLGLPKDLSEAARKAAAGEPRPLDIGRFDDRCFTYVASFGLFSEASYATGQAAKNLFGHLAYLVEGAKELTNIRKYHVKMTADGETIEDDFIYGSISNALSVGGILKMDPNTVDLSDGKLEIILLKPFRKVEDVTSVLKMLATHNLKGRGLVYRQASQITVEMPKPENWSLDGEMCPGGTVSEIRNLPEALEFVY